MNKQSKEKINLKPDGDGFLAEVIGVSGLYAFGLTKQEALSELKGVINAFIDIQLENIEVERHARLEADKRLRMLPDKDKEQQEWEDSLPTYTPTKEENKAVAEARKHRGTVSASTPEEIINALDSFAS